MGKAPTDVKPETLVAVEEEVDQLRQRTQALVEELERRIHARVDRARETVERVKHAVDLPAQLREHPRAAAGVGVGTMAAVGVGVWLLVRSRTNARRPSVILRRRAHALRQLLTDPERAFAHKEPLSRKVLGAVLATTATVLARAIAQRLVQDRSETRERRRLLPMEEMPPRV